MSCFVTLTEWMALLVQILYQYVRLILGSLKVLLQFCDSSSVGCVPSLVKHYHVLTLSCKPVCSFSSGQKYNTIDFIFRNKRKLSKSSILWLGNVIIRNIPPAGYTGM